MAIKLSRFVGVRFEPDDYRRLERVAARLGQPVSQVIRDAATGVRAKPRRRALADEDLINQLSRIGNTLNQQTRLLHQLRYRDLIPETAPVLAVLEDVRDLLREVSRRLAEASS